MPSHIQRLRSAIEEWLIRNEMDTDARFYSIEEWNARGEEYHTDSELVLIFEGGLYSLLNLGCDTLEFDDYIESFGYYYEMGHAWNMGFYRIPDYDFSPVQGNYSQKLLDPRWKKKAKLVKKQADNKCQDCGSTERLEAHHCYYTPLRSGHEPWEYPLSAFRCLCRNCHELREKSESRMRAYLARLTSDQLDTLRKNLDHAFYWFEKDAVLSHLANLGHSNEEILTSLEKLFQERNDTD